MSQKLSDKVALVTGGTSGIGLATTKQFVAEGAYVFITGRRQTELDAAVNEIGKNVMGIQSDVSNLADLDQLYATIKQEQGHLDVIFANAGSGEVIPLGSITEEHFDKTFNTNVKGLLFTVQKALPLMPEGAAIILNASTASIVGTKGKIKQESRTASAQPVTYRFVIKSGKIYLNATIDVPVKSNSTSLKNGALGVDFNPNSIDWAVIDKQGNLKRHGSIKINVQDKRTNQTKDIIGKACAELVRYAELYNIPIVVEDLDFENKKVLMKERGAKYARMLSNMSYSKFNQMLESRCQKFGIELLKINPAYTSVIGTTKYMAMYSLNSGCAAALVIARLAANRTENLPKSHATFFKKPEDLSKPGAWKKVARKINIVGGFNRHQWYSHGKKQVSSNSRMLRKLRQTSPPGGTVQLIESPHIQKTSALKVSLELVLSLIA